MLYVFLLFCFAAPRASAICSCRFSGSIGVLAQSEACVLSKHEVLGSKPRYSTALRYGVVGNISACHADARGSIPRFGVFFFRRGRRARPERVLHLRVLLGGGETRQKHTFSAFWLRSSVVSVLISLISGTWRMASHEFK